jgi:toxin-antitoxin system PIN domain toxin
MTTLDTNVLLYASDADSPFHPAALTLLNRLARGPELLTLFWPVLLGYLRIATRHGLFRNPLSPAAAVESVERLIQRRHVRVLGEADGFWVHFRDVSGAVNARGDLVADAHIVALMRQHGVREIWTHDRDFRKFDGIVMRDPFDVPRPRKR